MQKMAILLGTRCKKANAELLDALHGYLPHKIVGRMLLQFGRFKEPMLVSQRCSRSFVVIVGSGSLSQETLNVLHDADARSGDAVVVFVRNGFLVLVHADREGRLRAGRLLEDRLEMHVAKSKCYLVAVGERTT